MDYEKQKKIFESYKKSIKRAKFTPLGKNVFDIGNPLDHLRKEEEDKEMTYRVLEGVTDKALEYKIKILEKKMEKMYIINILSLIFAVAALYFSQL